jgi:hypothetical protein
VEQLICFLEKKAKDKLIEAKIKMDSFIVNDSDEERLLYKVYFPSTTVLGTAEMKPPFGNGRVNLFHIPGDRGTYLIRLSLGDKQWRTLQLIDLDNLGLMITKNSVSHSFEGLYSP